MNHECYVSFEIAKLLKEAGFDWEEHQPRNFCYVNDNTELFDKSVLKNYIGEDDVIYLAPTLDITQRWLREVKGLIVQIDFLRHNKWWYLVLQGERVETLENPRVKFNTYEEAQGAGIRKALEIILEKGE